MILNVYFCIIIINLINIKVKNTKKMKNEVFSQRLKNARLMNGMTQDEVVAALGETLSKNALSRYERGEMMPRYNILLALARVFSVQLEYFFRPFTVEVRNVDYRTKMELPSMEREKLRLEVISLMERRLETEQLLGLKQRFTNPLQDFPAVTTSADAEKAAAKLREAWQLGQHGLVNIYGILEHFGIKVVEISAHEAFDGMSATINQGIPLIVVNAEMTVERKRFTVLHETAHLLITFDPTLEQKKIESLCNIFAGTLLVPAAILKELIGAPREQISLQELIHIKNQFGISIQALVYRAARLNYISQATVDRFKYEIQSNIKEEGLGGYYGMEVADRFEQLVVRAYHSQRITRSKAAELLGVEEKDLPETIDKHW